MDYRKLVKALAVLICGIFLGKPIMDAVGSAVAVYNAAGASSFQTLDSASKEAK